MCDTDPPRPIRRARVSELSVHCPVGPVGDQPEQIHRTRESPMAFHRTALSAAGLTAAAVLFAGCSSTSTTAEPSTTTAAATSTTTTTTTSAAATPAGTLVGPGC